MTAQRSGLFTFRVLLITRDATRYLQHKVHLRKSLTHAGTCGKALQVQTLSRAKRHSPPLQVLRQSLLEYPGPSDCVWRTYESTLGGSHFSVIVSCTACGSMPRDQCGSLRTFPCGLLRGTPKTASSREESEIVHGQRTAKR